jgi:hypothetical protein
MGFNGFGLGVGVVDVRRILWDESDVDRALTSCLSLKPDVLILDAEPLLIDWRAAPELWRPGWSEMVSEIARQGVRSLVVVSNSRRDLSSLENDPASPRDLHIHCLSRAWKPWTTRRALGLAARFGPGVVCGDVSLTDGFLASRLRYSFVHLTVPDQPLYARIQDHCGNWLMSLLYRRVRPEPVS